MQFRQQISIYFKVLIPLLILVIWGVSPLPKQLDQAWRDIRQAQREARPQHAADGLRQVLAIQDWRVELWEDLAQAELAAGRPDQAAQALEQGARVGPLSPEGQELLGEVYEQQGLDDRAEAYWHSILVQNGPNKRVYERLARLQRRRSGWADSVETLRALFELEPGSAYVAYHLGLHLCAVQPVDALEPLLEASRLDSSYTPAVQSLRQALGAAAQSDQPAYGRLLIGRALGSLGEWDLAGASFRQALALSPDYAEAWAFLGEANHHLGLGGKTELDQAARLAPESPLVRALLALYWRRHGQPEKALEHLEAIARQEPDEPIWQVEMANTLVEKGDLPAAQTCFERAVAMAPNTSLYWQYLAWFSLQNGADIRGLGLEAARKAVLLAPNDPAALDVMGTALLYLGDLTTAERFLQRALERESTSSPVLLHLGQLYLQRQDDERAYAYLLRASQQAGEDATGIIARRLLQQYFGEGGS